MFSMYSEYEVFSTLSFVDQGGLVSRFLKRFSRKDETRHKKWNDNFSESR